VTETAAPARRPLVRQPDFLKLWAAETISVFGSQISGLAIPLVAALILKVEPFAFALLGTIEFLPFILFPLLSPVRNLRTMPEPVTDGGAEGTAAATA
jgi:hypothetical protein